MCVFLVCFLFVFLFVVTYSIISSCMSLKQQFKYYLKTIYIAHPYVIIIFISQVCIPIKIEYRNTEYSTMTTKAVAPIFHVQLLQLFENTLVKKNMTLALVLDHTEI